MASELADKLVEYNAVLTKTIEQTKTLKKKHKTALAAALAAAPAAPAAPTAATAIAVNAEVVKLRGLVSAASGQVTLLQRQQQEAKEEQRDAMRATLVLEAEVKRLRGDLAAMATALAAARDGQASGDPSPLQSSLEAEAKAADNADEGDGEPSSKKPRIA